MWLLSLKLLCFFSSNEVIYKLRSIWDKAVGSIEMFALDMLSNLFLFIRSEVFVQPLIVDKEVPHFFWEDEWFSISFETKFLFVMIQEMTKIDMEELTSKFVHHEITWMPISNSKSICSYTLPSRTHDIVMMHQLYLSISSFHGW